MPYIVKETQRLLIYVSTAVLKQIGLMNGVVGTLQHCIQKQYVLQDTLKWFIYNVVIPAAHVLIADIGIPYKI